MIITMKTYVLTLSKRFPTFHVKSGELTNFDEKFKEHQKIHTIRANYPFWEKRNEKIQNGEAILSIRQWKDKPYNSKQTFLAELTKENGVYVEKLIFKNRNVMRPALVVYDEHIEENKLIDLDPATLAKNDGLTLTEWVDWFSTYDLSLPMAILHFTKFRYRDLK